MSQPLRIQLLTMSKILEDLVSLVRCDLQGNLLTINKRLLEIEIYLDQIKTQKISRKMRLTLNKFEKGFKELKIHLFLNQDPSLFIEKAIAWADILQIRSKLA